jgi:hypothetical protein
MDFKRFMVIFGITVLAAVIVFSWGCQQNQPTAPEIIERDDDSGKLRAELVMRLRARSTDGAGQVRLIVGGNTVGTWTLGTSMGDHSVSLWTSRGDIRVEFFNDASGRDVQVDYLSVGGDTRQAENQATNTAVWQNGSCGGSYSEWMHCNGYIAFGNTPADDGTTTTTSGGSTTTTTSGSSGITGVKQLRNRGTGLYLDGMGRTNNGADCGQYANTTHPNAHWNITSAGSGYYYLINQGTNMKLDGYGRTGNGDACAQYSSSTTHVNAQWSIVSAGSGYYYLVNRGTNMKLDGYGRTENGSACAQYSNSTTHVNAQWQITDGGGGTTTTTTSGSTTTTTSGGGVNTNPSWRAGSRCFQDGPSGSFDDIAVKDPSIVYSGGRYHLFYTGRDNSSWRMGYATASSVSGLNNATHTYMSSVNGGSYFCAPQVFYCEAKGQWYLIYQSGQGATYSTNSDVGNHNGWSSGRSMFSGGLDYWCIREGNTMYIFYAPGDDSRTILRRSTSISNFPSGWSGASVVATNTFEGVAVYRNRADGQYYMVVEDIARHFELWRASSPGGSFTKLSEEWAAGNDLIYEADHWTDQCSHGEILRAGTNEYMEVNDLNRCDFLIQGVPSGNYGEYWQIPYDLGLIRNY